MPSQQSISQALARLRPLLIQYGPPATLAFFLVKHFGTVGKGNGSTIISSLKYSLRSRTLRNMAISAAIVSYVSKRLFGFKSSRVFPAFFFSIWAMVYKYRVVETPKVWFRRTYWNTHIVEKSRIAQTEFRPVVWAFNRHAQTITCYLVSTLEWLWAEQITYEREIIPCFDYPNKQFIDWAALADRKESQSSAVRDLGPRVATLPTSQVGEGSTGTHWDTPIILCIHGLGDDREIPYLKRFSRMCLKNGWRVAVWSYWRFDFEESRDLHLVIQHIQAQSPHAPIVAVAWSAGTYSLTRYLEKTGKDTPLVAAVCQGGCLDFVQAVTDVTQNENVTYPLFLLGQTLVCLKRHIENDKNIQDKEPFYALLRSERDTMRLYDQFMCLLPRSNAPDTTGLGHEGRIGERGSWEERVKSASHYNHSAIDSIQNIGITTLLLHAEDDPVVSSEHIDWQKIESNRNIVVAHTKRGGHCAWHEGYMPFGDTWGDRVTTNFISTVLESHSQTHFIVELVNQAMKQGAETHGMLHPPTAPHVSNPRSGLNLTPQAMARITSASDLASMASPTLAYAKPRRNGSLTTILNK